MSLFNPKIFVLTHFSLIILVGRNPIELNFANKK